MEVPLFGGLLHPAVSFIGNGESYLKLSCICDREALLEEFQRGGQGQHGGQPGGGGTSLSPEFTQALAISMPGELITFVVKPLDTVFKAITSFGYRRDILFACRRLAFNISVTDRARIFRCGRAMYGG